MPAVAANNDSDNPGRVMPAFTPGTTTLTASYSGISGMTTLTVRMATLMSIAVMPATGATVPAGMSVSFTATGTYSNNTMQDLTTQVTWSSTMTAVAEVSNADGTEGVATGAQGGLDGDRGVARRRVGDGRSDGAGRRC